MSKFATVNCRTHSDMTSNGNIFRVTGHLCGEFTGEFPAQRPVTRSFGVFFELRLNKRLSKQLRGWWFETLPSPLWRHCNDKCYVHTSNCQVACGIITASSIDSIYCVAGFWIIFHMLRDSADWIYLYNIKPFFFIVKHVYIIEWYSCQLFWNTFEIACFVQVRVDIIVVNCIRTSEMRNDTKMKTIANLEYASDFSSFVSRNWIIVFL